MSSEEGRPEGGEGPALVRPYALVRGRTRTGPGGPLPVESVVVTIAGGGGAGSPETATILEQCQTPNSVAELSAHLHLPVGVVRVLVADLIELGRVHVNLPGGRRSDGSVDRALLERVLAGLEAL